MEQGPSCDQPFYLNDAESATVEQLKSSDLKSLGDNVKLLAVIQNLSQDLVTKSEKTYKKIDEIHRETEIKSVGVKNLINEFQMLADSQFIENRIYDADQNDTVNGEQVGNYSELQADTKKVPPEQRILPIIHECIENSLKFIDDNFDLVDVQLKPSNESDEEDDYMKETIARALEKNHFNRTPLPAIIGSQEFFNQTIFSDAENRVKNSKYEYNSEPSDNKNSSLSDDSDDDDEALFSPSKSSVNLPKSTISIQPGNIPPPPPLPVSSGDSDDGEDLFSTEKFKPFIPQNATQKIEPELNRKGKQSDLSDDDDADEEPLFSPIKSSGAQPEPVIPNQSNLIPPRQSVSSEDSDGQDLFSTKKVSAFIPTSQKSVKLIESINNNYDRTDGNASDDSDEDLFNVSSKGTNKSNSDRLPFLQEITQRFKKPRSSSSDQENQDAAPEVEKPQQRHVITQKPSNTTISNTSKAPDLDRNEEDSDSDTDDLFSIPKTISSYKEKPSSIVQDMKKGLDSLSSDSDSEFNRPKTYTAPKPIENNPQKLVSSLPKSLKDLDDSDDEDDDLFSSFKKSTTKSSAPTSEVRGFEQRSKSEDDDDDDLFSVVKTPSKEPAPEAPPALKVRTSILPKAIPVEEKTNNSITSIDNNDANPDPGDVPKLIVNNSQNSVSKLLTSVKNLQDSDDENSDDDKNDWSEEDLFVETKKSLEKPSEVPPVPKQRTSITQKIDQQTNQTDKQFKLSSNDDDDDDEDDLFAKVIKIPLKQDTSANTVTSNTVKPVITKKSDIEKEEAENSPDDLFSTIQPSRPLSIVHEEKKTFDPLSSFSDQEEILTAPVSQIPPVPKPRTSKSKSVEPKQLNLLKEDSSDDDLFKIMPNKANVGTQKKENICIKEAEPEKTLNSSSSTSRAPTINNLPPLPDLSTPKKDKKKTNSSFLSDEDSDDSLFSDFKSKLTSKVNDKENDKSADSPIFNKLSSNPINSPSLPTSTKTEAKKTFVWSDDSDSDDLFKPLK